MNHQLLQHKMFTTVTLDEKFFGLLLFRAVADIGFDFIELACFTTITDSVYMCLDFYDIRNELNIIICYEALKPCTVCRNSGWPFYGSSMYFTCVARRTCAVWFVELLRRLLSHRRPSVVCRRPADWELASDQEVGPDCGAAKRCSQPRVRCVLHAGERAAQWRHKSTAGGSWTHRLSATPHPVFKQSNRRYQSPSPVRTIAQHICFYNGSAALLLPFNDRTENFGVLARCTLEAPWLCPPWLIGCDATGTQLFVL